MENLKKDFEDLNDQVNSKNKKIDELTKNITIKDEEINNLNAKNWNLESNIEDLTKKIKKLNNLIIEKDKTIQDISESLTEKDKIIEERTTNLEEVKAELNELKPPVKDDFQGEERLICPKCGAVGKNIKTIEDKTKILTYIGNLPMYGKIHICKKCGIEIKSKESDTELVE